MLHSHPKVLLHRSGGEDLEEAGFLFRIHFPRFLSVVALAQSEVICSHVTDRESLREVY